MNPLSENEQDFLAAKFYIDETHINQASHLAFLKIQSWKFALHTPSIGKRFKNEVADMLDQSFFTFVPNTHVLSEEGYYFYPQN